MKIKTLLLTFIAFCSIQTALGQNERPVPPPPEAPLQVLDEKAEFPGGISELNKYMMENLTYPESAIKEGIEGKAWVKFIVSKTGELSNVKVVKGIPGCKECDEEAIRLVKTMPNWIPGKDKGVAVHSYFTLPIQFKLQ